MESFHDKFRRECLGREIFYTMSECRVVVKDWKWKYNQVCQHRSLGMQTPVEFAKNHSN
ncbi:MAG: integrase core domain-containing protein [Verrucomicrobiota bacterium]